MSTPPAGAPDPRALAEQLVASVEEVEHLVSTFDRAALVDALTHDLGVEAHRASVSEAQLKHIETEAQRLAQALLALAATAADLAIAAGAAKGRTER